MEDDERERRPGPSFALFPDLFFYFAFEIREMWNRGVQRFIYFLV